jgi:hypothetical protein
MTVDCAAAPCGNARDRTPILLVERMKQGEFAGAAGPVER